MTVRGVPVIASSGLTRASFLRVIGDLRHNGVNRCGEAVPKAPAPAASVLDRVFPPAELDDWWGERFEAGEHPFRFPGGAGPSHVHGPRPTTGWQMP